VTPTDADRDPAFDRLIARGLARETGASGVACPDADLLAAWFDHSLSAAEAERIEAHASACGVCQQILGDLARSEPEVTRAAPVPAAGPERPWHWHWRWLVPLATAAVVVVVAERTLRAPGPASPGAASQPAIPRVSSTTDELREPPPTAPPSGRDTGSNGPPGAVAGVQAVRQKAAADSADARRSNGEAAAVAAAPVRAARAEPPPRMADRLAESLPVAAPNAVPAAGAAREAVGGTVGGVVGGVVGGISPAKAEGVAVVAPAQTALVRSAAVVSAPIPPDLPHSTTGTGMSGLTVTWRFGQGGVIERSTDRGQTWERQPSGVAATLVEGSAPGDRVCWIVGEHGVVLRTIDGRTWQRLPSPTPADLVAVHAWSESSATVTAADRAEYETTDGGKSWRRRDPGTPSPVPSDSSGR
jgi:hypothetical protein